ncbi:MarR family winged helix-turn-helix transcriptional regulator [Devosia sp.]|uniref:MarR family winged helix-turn-helix transcriptional regulator n=1 Tax=Devosia sp. TaxID=1871048 RepID=UPI003F725AEB
MSYIRETSAGYLTNWAARLFARAIERRLAGGNSGPMPVFFALQDGGAMTQKALAQLAAVEQPTMANTLSRMERDGLVLRTPDPNDRRSARVSLTPLGRERAKAAFVSAIEVNGIATDALQPEERELFYDMMRRIIAALERDAAA